MADKNSAGGTGQSSQNSGTRQIHIGEGARAPKTVPTRPPKK